MEEDKETTPIKEEETINEPISESSKKKPKVTVYESQETKTEETTEKEESPEKEESEENKEPETQEDASETEKSAEEKEPEIKKDAPEQQTTLDKPSEPEEETKSSKFVVGFIVGLIIIVALIVAVKYVYTPTPEPETLTPAVVVSDAHRPSQDTRTEFTHNGFDFKKVDSMWTTEIKKGNTVYAVEFYYSPSELEEVPFEGFFDDSIDDERVYVTFDPNDENLTFVALAMGQLDMSLVKSFGKGIIGACANQDSEACTTVPTITCESNVTEPIFFLKESDETKVDITDNCAMVYGRGWDLVKATEALLMRGYNIIKKE